MDSHTFMEYQKIIQANHFFIGDFECNEKNSSYSGPAPYAGLHKTDYKTVITIKYKKTGREKDYEIGDEIVPLTGVFSWLDEFQHDLISGFFDAKQINPS